MKINDKVIELFNESGLDQFDFRKKYKLPKSHFEHVINKHNKCSWGYLEKLCKKMGKKLVISIK